MKTLSLLLTPFLLAAGAAFAQDPGLPLDLERAPASAEAAAPATPGANDGALRRVQVLHGFLSEQSLLWLSVAEEQRAGRAKVLFHLASQQLRWLDALTPQRLPGGALKPLLAAHELAQKLIQDFRDGVAQGARRGRLAGIQARLAGREPVRESQPGEPSERLERVQVLSDLFDELKPVLDFLLPARRAAIRAALLELLALQEKELEIVQAFDLGPAGAPIKAHAAVLQARVRATRAFLAR